MNISISSPFYPDKPEGLNISDDGQTLISVGTNISGTVVVPEGITHINDWAFSECLIDEVKLPSTLKSIGERAFDSCSRLQSIIIPEGIKELPFCLFRGCDCLSEVSLPQSLTQIGSSVFEYCRKLRRLTIPINVKEISTDAFGECSELYECILPDGLETIGQGAFEGCSALVSITLPNSLKSIIWQAFMGCRSLSYIYIPKSVSEIGTRAFAGTNAYIEVDNDNQYYSSIDGSLYDKGKERLLNYHASKPVCIINSPSSLSAFGGGVFQGLNILREIQIDVSTESLDNCSLYGCRNLRKVVLPEGLKRFDGCGNCPSLEVIYLPDSIETIPQCAFEDCTSLKSIKLPKCLKNLGYKHQGQVFSGCISLENVEFNHSLEIIAPSNFLGCSSLREITLPDSISLIGYSAFRDCCKLKDITIPPSVKKIESKAFANCVALESFTCLSEEIDISNSSFSGCKSLKKIVIRSFSPSDLFVKYSDCTNLEQIVYFEDDIKRTFDVKEAKHSWQDRLKLMSMFYYNMDMNIVKVKGSSGNYSSFKEPFESESNTLNYLKNNRQDVSVLLNQTWKDFSGIALVLDWNNYQAIDVDNIYNTDSMTDMVTNYLDKLGLPSDYPWVVNSGSGKGFHIIYISEKVDSNIDIYPFAPRKNAFENLEIRTGGILVLPPSIHFSGRKYDFVYKDMPKSFPQKVTTNIINDFLLDVCGNISFARYKYNEISFELCEYKKIKSRSFSLPGEHVSHSDDTINWLEKCNSPLSYNSYAVRLVLGKDITADKQKALEYFKKADNDYAFFNIASLMSVGYFNGSLAEIDYYLSKIDKTKLYSCDFEQNDIEPDERIEDIRNNAKQYSKKGRLLLFFDTETTGVPQNCDLPSSYTENWPRMVQISWILMSEDGQRINQKTYTIKPNNYKIPDSAIKVHGITNEYAHKYGVDLHDVLAEFINVANHAEILVGHNISFDRNVVGAELIRDGFQDFLDNKEQICTMKASKEFCKIRGIFGLKYPKLQELYRILFGSEFDNAHDASADIEATQKCYWELKRLGLII